jgi:hypothetical protein
VLYFKEWIIGGTTTNRQLAELERGTIDINKLRE